MDNGIENIKKVADIDFALALIADGVMNYWGERFF
jgi:hypothetical protein